SIEMSATKLRSARGLARAAQIIEPVMTCTDSCYSLLSWPRPSTDPCGDPTPYHGGRGSSQKMEATSRNRSSPAPKLQFGNPRSLFAFEWERRQKLPALPEKRTQTAAFLNGLRRMEPVLIGSVRLALRRSTARTVEAAHGPAAHRGSLAPLARALRGCR